MVTDFITSDTHFGHLLVAELRGFNLVEEHDRALIENWNQTVGKNDTVYHLGDFSMSLKHVKVGRLLNGRIILIAGNHDQIWHRRFKSQNIRRALRQTVFYQEQGGFHDIITAGTMLLGNPGSRNEVVLSHLPVSGDHRDIIRYQDRRPLPGKLPVLCGHVHGAWKTQGKQLNVGVDVWNYRPIRLDEATKIVERLDGVGAAGPMVEGPWNRFALA